MARPAAPTRGRRWNGLVENPDDLAAHLAYADYLAEQSDPALAARGGSPSPCSSPWRTRPGRRGRRKRLQMREAELFTTHGREWLGGLAPLLIDEEGVSEYQRRNPELYGNSFQFRRGWLDRLRLYRISEHLARAVGSVPRSTSCPTSR